MWNRILVPVDFSDSSQHALELACEISQRWGAILSLLNVYQIPGFAYPEGFIPASAEVFNTLLTETERALEVWKKEALALGATRVEIKTAQGAAFSEILREAQKHDLIVMGTHGRSGLSYVFLGSVAAHVVRLAECPVLTVRLPASEAKRAGHEYPRTVAPSL